MLTQNRDEHSRVFRALGFMNRNSPRGNDVS